MGKRLLRIGISACFDHPDPNRKLFRGKRLLYVEQQMTQYVMGEGALPIMLPVPARPIETADVLGMVDGLLLHGGSDVAPESYGEHPMAPEWGGDYYRDQYEIDLVNHAMDMDVPIFGICRGAQILNVALGGTLYQDIQTQLDGSLNHRNAELYDQHGHDVRLVPGSRLSEIYGGVLGGRINSIHHQALNRLGDGLVVEAHSAEDGIVEAIRFESDERYAAAVQWHPEFHDREDTDRLDRGVLMRDFFDACQARK